MVRLSLFRRFLLTPFLEQIVDGLIDLDPDYQRGMRTVHFSRQWNVASVLRRCGLVGTKADRSHRLCISQLLHPAYHLW
jgi:hypothetical protein